MSFSAMAWAVKQETKSPVSKLVLLMIANYADENGEAYPSQEHLAKLCECTRVSVNKHIKQLEKLNFITIKKTKNGMFGYNKYKLNLGYVNNINIPSKEYLHNTQDIHICTKFDIFWNECPRKIGKKKAESIYKKLINKKEVSEELLIKAMKNYSLSVAKTELKYIVHPVTWLNQGRWDDEIIKQEKNKNFQLG